MNQQVADVVKHSSTARGPVRAMAVAPSVRERHVVMCGSVSAKNLQARLKEIFHADHGNHNVRWVRVSRYAWPGVGACVFVVVCL